jgi:zinc protease
MKNLTIKKIAAALLWLFIGVQSTMAQDNFKLPAHTKVTYVNGLTVYFVVQKEVPLVHFRAVFPAGVRYDSQAKAGLASLTANALSTGTKRYTKAQIEETLDFIGASISNGASTESASLAATFVNKDQDQVLPILAEMITQPVFPADEFEKMSQRAIASIDQMRESPRSVINNYFNAMVYKDHPYANIASGTKNSLESIAASDLNEFYRAHYTPRGTVMAVVGDFNLLAMKQAIENLFVSWENNTPPPTPAISIKAPTEAKVVIVNKQDARETTMLIGGIGVARNTEDFIAIQVINTILGGRFTSMLNDELRVNSGLTYGARSSFNALKEGGTFNMSTFTANESTKETIALALKTYQKIFDGAIDEKTLTSAKNYVKGQFPPDYETNAAIARFYTDAFIYGIPMNYIDNFSATVDGLTVKKAKLIIERYFPKDHLQMVFIGKASLIQPLVNEYGSVKVFEITQDVYQ